MSLLEELKRRKVFRVAIVYAATAFAVLQAADILLPNLGVPEWVMSLVVALCVLGFPIALVMGWALELTPEGGVKRTATEHRPSNDSPALLGKSTLLVAGGLVLVGLGLSAGWFLKPDAPAQTTQPHVSVQSDGRRSVAVLPFDSMSDDPAQGYFADGLTEEILNALAALPKLLVTARTSSFFYKDKNVPVDEIAERLGVDHILEGSVRRSGERMRITAQLIRAADGFHLWSQTYDRPIDDAFAVQTDIATQVATSLGILLDDAQRARMEASGVRDPEAYALFAEGSAIYQLAHGGAPQIPTLVRANERFDEAFEREPALWVARYLSADLYTHTLLELAAGTDPAALPAEHVAIARREHDARLRDAARAAPNAAARDFVEITRRLASDNWTGLGELVRQAFEHEQSCGFDQWMHVIGPAFGMADSALAFFLRGTRCNGIDESNWLHAAHSAIYAEDSEQALAITERGTTIANITGFGLGAVEIEALIALDRLDEARARLPRLAASENYTPEIGRAWILAAEGDKARLDVLLGEIQQPLDTIGISNRLGLAARSGNREAANALASDIDAEPGGPMLLMTGVYFCLCGAPFDLEVTPNLAERLNEAGLSWPPPETLAWPLKDW